MSDHEIIPLEELIKNEVQFCAEIECEKNEHGVMLYTSTNSLHSMNLPFILLQYKKWLIKRKIVKE